MFGTRNKIENKATIVEPPIPVKNISDDVKNSKRRKYDAKVTWKDESDSKIRSDEAVMISNVTGLSMTASDVEESLNRLTAHRPLDVVPSIMIETICKDDNKVSISTTIEKVYEISKDVQAAITVDIKPENPNNTEELQTSALNNIESNSELSNDGKREEEADFNSDGTIIVSNLTGLPITATDVEANLDRLRAHYSTNINELRDELLRKNNNKAKANTYNNIELPETTSEHKDTANTSRRDDDLVTISIAFNSPTDKDVIDEEVIDLRITEEQDSDSFDIPITYQIPETQLIPESKSHRRSSEGQMDWKKSGVAVNLRYHKISGGMVYVGRESSSYSYDRHEPSLIDLDFPVDPDPKALRDALGYYPSYQYLSPKQKGAYLYWLSHGRNDPSVDIGYVFLYFYGLERRALIDLVGEGKDKEEATVIYNEVKRLLQIYKDSDSFSRYVGEFIGLLNVMYDFEPFESANLSTGYNYELPISLKIELGKHTFQKKPLPVSLVMLWFEHNPYFYTRTPFDRCRSEFNVLFQKRYQLKYGEGIVVSKVPKRNLRIQYQYANNSLGSPFHYSVDNVPDVGSMSQVFDKITALVEECTNELDAYSRFLGRNQEKRDSILSYSLLPDELIQSLESPILISLSNWLDAKFINDKFVVVLKEEVLRLLKFEDSQKLTPKEWLGVVQLFMKLGVGIEADPRFGSTKLDKVRHLVLFKVNAKSVSTPSIQYSFIQLFLHLASYFGGSSTQEREAEKLHLIDWIGGQKELSDSEKQRLIAHLEWLYIEQPEISTTKKRIQSLTETEKTTFVTQLIILAGIDGQIEAEEVKMLQKVYEWINRDESQLFSDLHSLQSDGEVSPKSSGKRASKTDKSIDGTHVVVLDTNKIKKRLAETKEVNAILSTVFADIDDQPQAKRTSKKDRSKTIGNLDEVHSLLILELVKNTEWPRDQFETICQNKGLFADGALEMINEAAFTIADEALIEDDDPLIINLEVAKKMKAL